jgi:hypothetical protein
VATTHQNHRKQHEWASSRPNSGTLHSAAIRLTLSIRVQIVCKCSPVRRYKGTQRTCTRGDVRSENPPSRSSSASWQAVRSSCSVLPPSMLAKNIPSGFRTLRHSANALCMCCLHQHCPTLYNSTSVHMNPLTRTRADWCGAPPGHLPSASCCKQPPLHATQTLKQQWQLCRILRGDPASSLLQLSMLQWCGSGARVQLGLEWCAQSNDASGNGRNSSSANCTSKLLPHRWSGPFIASCT